MDHAFKVHQGCQDKMGFPEFQECPVILVQGGKRAIKVHIRDNHAFSD
jgi:hypothetical protein